MSYASSQIRAQDSAILAPILPSQHDQDSWLAYLLKPPSVAEVVIVVPGLLGHDEGFVGRVGNVLVLGVHKRG